MNRREAVQRISLLMGGALSAPAMAGILGQKTNMGHSLAVSAEQEALLAEVADVIIPATSTPGAKAAGAEKFIVRVMRDCYPIADQEKFYASLANLEKDSRSAHGKSFGSLENGQKKELVKKLTVSDQPFFRRMKELTTIGYFTSEIGATQALEYVEVPGKFEACIPYKAGQKAWAL
ncbi:gluconate 2-dehydrogenase subunit 3 family protein [Arundinibacter roseus]|uniref:Gluconate 2-dehydrogenase subunit 3 family protein n=1 Tax=Arundinibacter roseus TaxID=2070510 RepID=A0A4V2X9J8_9BACT|nr:gluconate 2-dehydrogenase subunit 3 family protein [Arundinibacter roseus]TDB63975.1 gluconate 2-dehydrogenase subunit 3 family protein [Arundinibacter roseus]